MADELSVKPATTASGEPLMDTSPVKPRRPYRRRTRAPRHVNSVQDEVAAVEDGLKHGLAHALTSDTGGQPVPQTRKPIQAVSRRNAALARRLASGNPFGGGSKRIPMREDGAWATRIASSSYDRDDRHYEMRQKGWEPVTLDDLACTPDEIGFRAEDGVLKRGARGQDILYKMPKADFDALQQMKTDRNKADIGRPAKVRENIAAAAATTHGDEAASYIQKHLVGTVTDTQGPLVGG